MKRLFLPACLLAMTVAGAFAQEQEQGLLDRIDAKRRLAIQSMDGKSKPNPELTSPLANQNFQASSAKVKTFDTVPFGGVKNASVKTFETRSFLGLKNPWFGKKVFDTYASAASGRTAREANQDYQTQAFAVREYEKAKKQDLAASTELASAAQPRPYLVAPKAPGSVDRMTQNLQKELSIDDVRDLLNKGHGE